jgi:hypothetical protein
MVVAQNYKITQVDSNRVRVLFPSTARLFKMSALYSNRVYYYYLDWNRDFYELPEGKWVIESESFEGVTFKKI